MRRDGDNAGSGAAGGVSRRRSDSRDRMVLSAAELLREYGAGATSIDRVLVHSGAPRGSVYHHFPGGRAQLID
ncbi:TetR family transcriptional regulator, partial [Streptomyces sp. 2MCAF27]